jgi:peptidoglycan/LPS O-acetylase OafA/YrhL
VFGYQEPSWRNVVWFAVLFAVDLLLAWALYRFIEHPVERRMRRWKDARDAKARAAC